MSVDSLSEVSSDVSDEGNTPLCAVPPEIRREEKSHRHEVGSSPAYQCLEEVCINTTFNFMYKYC